MRALKFSDVVFPQTSALAIALALLGSGAWSQFPFGLGDSTAPTLTPGQVHEISGAAAARLEQARALLANANWDEAIDVFQELSADQSDRVVEVEDGRFIDLLTYCQLQLAGLPKEGLAAYRRRVDPMAAAWYRDGVAKRDSELLERVIDESFVSSWGDDALMALGELALERGDFEAARRYWLQISPLLRAPDGMPLWIALRDIDIAVNWSEIVQRWNSRESAPSWLAFPDTKLNLAEVRARLILASCRAGELERAELELQFFKLMHGNATGRLGGQDGPLVPALEGLLSSASAWQATRQSANWPTFAGAQSRCPNAVSVEHATLPCWREPLTLSVPEVPRGERRLVAGGQFGGVIMGDSRIEPAHAGERTPASFPVVVDSTVLVADAKSVRAADLATGRAAVTSDGMLYRDEDEAQAEPESMSLATIAHGSPSYSLAVVDRVVFARVGTAATTRTGLSRTSGRDRIVGFDLDREGLLVFSVQADDASWSFDGVPVSDGRRLYVAMRHSEVTPRAYVACFDLSGNTMIWRTSVGAGDTLAGGQGDEITHNLLTLVDDRIYINTNLGMVAALDKSDGRLRWVHRYNRVPGRRFSPDESGPEHYARDPSPCLAHAGLVIAAPTDSPVVFALDAETGMIVWENSRVADGLHLLGIVDKKLVMGGRRLRSLDVRSGRVLWTWPESAHAGIRGMGRGLVAGDEVFWPTRTEIYIVDAASGARTRAPISLAAVGSNGANLAAGSGHLVVAAMEKVVSYGPALRAPAEGTNDDDAEAVAVK